MAGFVYIMTNAAFLDLVKIGKSAKDPQYRKVDLETTGVPDQFIVEYFAFVKDFHRVEMAVHNQLSSFRYKENREFFGCGVTKGITTIRDCASSGMKYEEILNEKAFDELTKKTQIYANGDKYVGQFKDELRHGKGTYFWANGDKYEGDWKVKPNGHGTFTYLSGDKYVGEVKDEKKHGKGTYTFANGDKFEGDWKEDKMHGQVIYTTSKYESVCEYKDGKKVNESISRKKFDLGKAIRKFFE